MCRRGNKDVVIVRVLLGKGHALESVRGGKNDLAVRVISRSGSGGGGGGGGGGDFFLLFVFFTFPFAFSLSRFAFTFWYTCRDRAGGGGDFLLTFILSFASPFPVLLSQKKLQLLRIQIGRGGRPAPQDYFSLPLFRLLESFVLQREL